MHEDYWQSQTNAKPKKFKIYNHVFLVFFFSFSFIYLLRACFVTINLKLFAVSRLTSIITSLALYLLSPDFFNGEYLWRQWKKYHYQKGTNKWRMYNLSSFNLCTNKKNKWKLSSNCLDEIINEMKKNKYHNLTRCTILRNLHIKLDNSWASFTLSIIIFMANLK